MTGMNLIENKNAFLYNKKEQYALRKEVFLCIKKSENEQGKQFP